MYLFITNYEFIRIVRVTNLLKGLCVMDLYNMIDELRKMRFLGEDDNIDDFDEIISQIGIDGDLSVIKELCLIFEDDIDFPSASESLMKCIFYICNKCGDNEGIYEWLKNMHRMFPQGQKCAIKMTRMILNTEKLIPPYINALNKVDEDTKKESIQILNKIKSYKPDMYEEKVDFILDNIL